jgi:hypothetical protein
MRIWCRHHKVLFTADPSGYHPASSWRCPTQPLERVSWGDIRQHIAPVPLAGIVYARRGQVTRLIGVMPGPGYRG